MIIADTNLIAALLLPRGEAELAEAVLAVDPDWIAPLLWRSEFTNVLAVHLQRQAFGLDDALALLSMAELRMRGRAMPPDPRAALRLSAESGCSAYDCEFVALARELDVPLVTADKRLLREFPGVAIAYRDFAA